MIATRRRCASASRGRHRPARLLRARARGGASRRPSTSYIYVTVKRHSELFYEPIRLNYSREEEVNHVDELENDIARECMRFLEIEPPIYISTVGDLPASTGLGGSSAFAVGLLNALHAFRGERVSAGAAGRGGVSHRDRGARPADRQAGSVRRGLRRPQPLPLPARRLRSASSLSASRAPSARRAFDCACSCSGRATSATPTTVLERAESERSAGSSTARADARPGRALHDAAPQDGALDLVARSARLLDEGWQLKRELASTITNPRSTRWHDRALAAGALGGKLCGAGSGGFLLFLAPPERQDAVRVSVCADMLEVRPATRATARQVVGALHEP